MESLAGEGVLWPDRQAGALVLEWPLGLKQHVGGLLPLNSCTQGFKNDGSGTKEFEQSTVDIPAIAQPQSCSSWTPGVVGVEALLGPLKQVFERQAGV